MVTAPVFVILGALLLVTLLEPQKDTEETEKNVLSEYNSANIFLGVAKFGQPFAQLLLVISGS